MQSLSVSSLPLELLLRSQRYDRVGPRGRYVRRCNVEPDNLFHPVHFEKVRLPLLEAETLPPWCYSSEAFYRGEVNRVFMRSWNAVGRVETLAEAGDYRAMDLVGVALLLVRGNDGVIRAFANSCRHRGSQVASGSGNCSKFACPYHGWAYDLEGRLLGARGMKNTERFKRGDYGLVPVRLETWGGFMFVTFDPDTPSILDWMGDLNARVESYHMEELRCVRYLEYELAVNWKIWMEGASEDFHVPTVHGTTLGKLKVRHWTEPTSGQYSYMKEDHEGTRAVLPGEKGFPFIANLEGPAAKGTQYVVIYPNLAFAATRECVFFTEMQSLAVDRITLRVGVAFPQDTLVRADFEEVSESYYRRLDVGTREDINVAENQQIGLNSPLCRPGRISDQEPNIHRLWKWILGRVLDPALGVRKVVGR